MKLNWGWGIAIAYSIFALFFIGILIFSFGVDNSLVVDDYYSQDIGYQAIKEKRSNYSALSGDITYQFDPAVDVMTLTFPADANIDEGTIQFYRPSSSKQDYKVALSLDGDNKQQIPLPRLIAGQWIMKAEWQSGAKAYLWEERFFKP